MRRGRTKKMSARQGLAVVELALLLPLLCALFVVAVDFARVFYFDLTLASAARNGAIYGSQDPTKANDTAGIQTNAGYDLTSLPTVVVSGVTYPQVSSSTDSSTSPTTLTVTVTYPFNTITRYPVIPQQYMLSRTVQISVVPLTPN
jgi:Flp pilus assembly protein TadG